jgi:hypothetical protein
MEQEELNRLYEKLFAFALQIQSFRVVWSDGEFKIRQLSFVAAGLGLPFDASLVLL